jgi:hypothetical protein
MALAGISNDIAWERFMVGNGVLKHRNELRVVIASHSGVLSRSG